MRISQDSFSFQITETAEMSVRNKVKMICNFFYNVVAIELIMSSSTTSYDGVEIGVCFSIPVLNLHLNFKCWFLFLLCSWILLKLLFHISSCFFFLSLLVRFVCFYIIVFYFTRDVHQPLSQIRMSLSGSLGVGQIIFLAGINSTKNTVNGFSFHPSSKVGFVS